MESEPRKTPLIAIVGPTASGKSDMAMELARKYSGEIICADSRTVYREMDIGTAKPTPADRGLVPHHLLDIINPDKPFNASDFKKLANEAIEDIRSRGKIPFLVGGSGLYIDAVLFDYSFAPAGAGRSEINQRHLSKTVAVAKKNLSSDTIVIGLKLPREALLQRIAERTKQMINSGLIEETKGLASRYGWMREPMKSIGYREWRGYFAGQKNKKQAEDQIINSTKRFAKRQITWFKRNKDIAWVKNLNEADKLAKEFLSKFDTIKTNDY